MEYDPTIYLGSAAYYLRGRPPYSSELEATLASLVPLDGRGRLLDVGCGPGVLATRLAPYVQSVVAVDPDADMLAEGKRNAAQAGIGNIEWIRARGEDLATLGLGTFRLATFGQSFQWMERERVAELIFDMLEPDGAIVLLAHTVEGRPVPQGPGPPPIPHASIRAIIDRFLGTKRRAGQGFTPTQPDRYADALARTRFGRPTIVFAPGRTDLVQDVDGVLANYLSMSFCAPHLFGARLDEFCAAVRAALEPLSPDGRFWDWPGDTEILIARR